MTCDLLSETRDAQWLSIHERTLTMNIPVVEQILFANNTLAEDLRRKLDVTGVFGINVMASASGGGQDHRDHRHGRTASQPSQDRLRRRRHRHQHRRRTHRRADVPVVQINTGGNCHLDANMLAPAVDKLPLDDIDLMIVENVGNSSARPTSNSARTSTSPSPASPKATTSPTNTPPCTAGRRADPQQGRLAALHPLRRRALQARRACLAPT